MIHNRQLTKLCRKHGYKLRFKSRYILQQKRFIIGAFTLPELLSFLGV